MVFNILQDTDPDSSEAPCTTRGLRVQGMHAHDSGAVANVQAYYVHGLLTQRLSHLTVASLYTALASCAVLGNGLHVQQSTIPSAGMGLWTTRNFRKNEFITYYSGRRVTGDREVQKIMDEHRAGIERGEDAHSHTLSVNRFELIIGFKGMPPPPQQGGGSYANDGGPSLNNSRYHKLTLNSGKDVVLLKATTNIDKGSEIFVSYGKTYWITRGLPRPK